jgi:hypothetical protein
VRIVDEMIHRVTVARSIDVLSDAEAALAAYISLFPSYSDEWHADAGRVRAAIELRLEQLVLLEVQS